MRFVGFVLVLLASLTWARDASRSVESGTGSYIESLTRDNFESKLRSWEMSLVAFYAHWCTESQALLPKIEQTAKLLHDSGSNVRLAAVEATLYPEIRHKHKVTAFPTIKVFINGQAAGVYTGPMHPADIHKFFDSLRKQLASGVKPNVNPDAVATEDGVIHHHGHVVQLTADNFKTEVSKHPLALVNFGAGWCKWTRALLPEFNSASTAVSLKYPDVLLAGVDCQQETELEHLFRIRAFPTLLMFRDGVLVGQYVGQRSSGAIAAFVDAWMAHAKVPVEEHTITTAPNAAAMEAETSGPDNEKDPNQTAAIVVTVAILSCMALFTGVVLTVTYFGQPVPEEEYRPWWYYATGVRSLADEDREALVPPSVGPNAGKGDVDGKKCATGGTGAGVPGMDGFEQQALI